MSIMSTRAPAAGPAARGDALLIFEWLAEPPKGRASSASAGSAEGGCVALLQASTCAARPVGAAPRICGYSIYKGMFLLFSKPPCYALDSPVSGRLLRYIAEG